MKCKKCKTELGKNDKVCPNCGAKRPKGWIIAIVVVALLCIVIVAMAISGEGGTDTPTTTEPETEYITMDEYNQIKNGMTYEQVVKIIGCEGKLATSSEIGGSTSQTYGWSSRDLGGGTTYGATIIFVDGKVTGKYQTGLDIADDVSSAIKDLS